MTVMYQRYLFRLLLLPSLLSGLSVMVGSVCYLVYAGWQYIQDNQYFYEFLFGSYGTQTYLWQRPFATPPWLDLFFSGSLAYFTTLVTFAVIVGVIVYGVLQMFAGLRAQKTEIARTIYMDSLRRDGGTVDLITRMALRVMAVLGWGLYALFFASTVLEVITMLLHGGIDRLQTGDTALGLLQLAGVTLLTIAATHIHIYFLRLAVLRARVFRSDRTIAAVEAAPANNVRE
jgi:hypothetical protein